MPPKRISKRNKKEKSEEKKERKVVLKEPKDELKEKLKNRLREMKLGRTSLEVRNMKLDQLVEKLETTENREEKNKIKESINILEKVEQTQADAQNLEFPEYPE